MKRHRRRRIDFVGAFSAEDRRLCGQHRTSNGRRRSSISSRGELHRRRFLCLFFIFFVFSGEEAESQMTKGKRDLGHPAVRSGPSRIEPGTNQAPSRKARYFAGCRFLGPNPPQTKPLQAQTRGPVHQLPSLILSS